MVERSELTAVNRMKTKPGKQAVAETKDGELIELGPDPMLHVGPLEDDPRYD